MGGIQQVLPNTVICCQGQMALFRENENKEHQIAAEQIQLLEHELSAILMKINKIQEERHTFNLKYEACR